jgi:hypothetical protein
MTHDRIGFLDFARLVIDALEATDLTYLIGGAVAVWAWGEPRTTQDFDLVIHLPVERIASLSRALEQRRMLVPPDILLDLVLQPDGDLPVNAIHLDSGYKAELFVLREGDAFRSAALGRRQLVDLGPPLGKVFVHSPEDLILNKVAYYGLSQQTKHIYDIASILATLGMDYIDWTYFNFWVEKLGLEDAWSEVNDEVERLLG